MANDNDWDDDNEPTNNNSNNSSSGDAGKSGGLRSHLKKVELEKAELEAKLKTLEDSSRKTRVEAAVKARGFDPEVAELIPETVASDDATLDKWLTEKEKLFGKPNKQAEDSTVNQGFTDGDNLEEDADGYMRVSRVASAAIPATKEADVRARIAGAKTRGELDELLRGMGNQFVG